jgi:hypothetical protein
MVAELQRRLMRLKLLGAVKDDPRDLPRTARPASTRANHSVQ